MSAKSPAPAPPQPRTIQLSAKDNKNKHVTPSNAKPASKSENPLQYSTLKPETEASRVKFLQTLVAPHIESFNFAVTEGLKLICDELEPIVIEEQKPRANLADKAEMDVHGGGQVDLAEDANASTARKPWVSIKVDGLSLAKPTYHMSSQSLQISASEYGSSKLLPRHARESNSSYTAELVVHLLLKNSSGDIHKVSKVAGHVPIMVRSAACNLHNLTPKQLRALDEEEYEFGGYFISNGTEKLLRMLISPKKNHMVAIKRDANTNRGPLYSEYSVSMRCSRSDLTTKTIHMHYLTSGSCNVRLIVKRQEYFVPVGIILKALLPTNTVDSEIFDLIVGPDINDENLFQSVANIMHDLAGYEDHLLGVAPGSTSGIINDGNSHNLGSPTKDWCLEFLGSRFRVILDVPSSYSDREAGQVLLRRYVLVHLSTKPNEPSNQALDTCKAHVLGVMIRKLTAVAKGSVMQDDPDSLMHQELLLPGHIYLLYLKEKLEEYLLSIKNAYTKEIVGMSIKGKTVGGSSFRGSLSGKKTLTNMGYVTYLLGRAPCNMISQRMLYFIATGNLQSTTGGLDLMQTVGFSVVAERINFLRYISHFRCVHRGQFFTEVKTTSVRRLLPEAFGFICPVHTPDGAPCGLLNHLTHAAVVNQQTTADFERIGKFILSMGIVSVVPFSAAKDHYDGYIPEVDSVPVMIDGRVLGFVQVQDIKQIGDCLREEKCSTAGVIPMYAEIACVPKRRGGPYPGVYIFTGPARLMRPLHWLQSTSPAARTEQGSKTLEYVGTMEQMFLRIRGHENDRSEPEEDQVADQVGLRPPSHAETNPMNMLSILGSMTPLSDLNQSPRNMYQCQMAKQAMGTPYHSWNRRADTKAYRLLTPQVPMIRNFAMQDPAGLDAFPNGLNAVVCVISYTGYDMEDALIINKASLERGFAAGYVYLNQVVDLDDTPAGCHSMFGGNEGKGAIGEDGLPEVGARVNQGDPLYSIIENVNSTRIHGDLATKVTVHKNPDPAIVDQVRILATSTTPGTPTGNGIRKASIKLRLQRNPNIGDKFASRHGQKGTLASMWPQEDMPFSESGIIPDILFNPNGFPSRMTIGMMVESMCGKSAATMGVFQDSTPFRFDEKMPAHKYFSEQLLSAGYSYYGNEVMYSGYTGQPFEVDIFMGVVHYQRLRHMVSDKFQVRATGPMNPMTRQPIKGRKKGGAIRLGEMERDALLAHGSASLIQDRLQNNSDLYAVHVCVKCGSLVSPYATGMISDGTSLPGKTHITCRYCRDSTEIRKVLLPYVYRYLVNEIGAMNFGVKLGLL